MNTLRPRGQRPIALLCLLVFALGATALSPGCGRKEPVHIGFVGGLSGRVADLGISGRNGAMLALEMKNEAGGVKGRPVRLTVRDDEQKVATALRVDRELVDLGVAAIIGHMTSSMSLAAVPLLTGSGTVMVSPTTTTTFLTGIDDNFIRVSATTREYASKMASHLRDKVGVTVVSVIYDLGNRAYTESWYEEFRKEFTARGGLIAGVATYTSGPEAGFYGLVEKALASHADGLVIVAGAMDTAMLCQQVRKLGREVIVAAAEWAATERLLELGGAAVEGVIVSQFFDRESAAPAYTAFRETYRRRFGEEPGFAAVNAFDAASLLLDALENKREGESLKAAILRISAFDGIQGPVVIDAFGDADRKAYITMVRDGRFQVVE